MSMLAENSPKPAAVLRVENLAADAGPLRLFSGVSFTLKPADALILRGPGFTPVQRETLFLLIRRRAAIII